MSNQQSEPKDQAARNPQQSVFGRLVRAVSTLSGFTMVSRFLGLARESVVTAIIGPGPIMDAYVLALKLPNMFRQMFAEGALSASFVPLFAETQNSGDEEKARHFASAVTSALLLLIGGATVLAILFMRPIIGLLNPPVESFELSILFTRIMSIYLLCMVLTALITGVLNAKQHFAAGAIAPVFLNICIIGGLLFGVYALELPDALRGHALAIAVAVSGVVQVVFVWSVAALKFKFVIYVPVPKFSPQIRKLFRLMIPGLIAAGGLQLNTLVGLYLALRNTGDASYLNTAERLYQLPVGLIAVAFGVAALPQLASFFANNQRQQAIQTINLGVELALFIAIPAAFALVAMPDVIVKLLFENGKFDANDTVAVAELIAVFALALPALALQRVFNASFHARKVMRPPMIMTLVGVGINVVSAVVLTPMLGLVAIPAAIAISAWFQVIVLGTWVRLDALWQPSWTSAWRAFAVLAAGGIMAGSLWAVKPSLLAFADDSTLRLLVVTTVMVAGGMLVYFAASVLLRGLAPEFRKMIPFLA